MTTIDESPAQSGVSEPKPRPDPLPSALVAVGVGLAILHRPLASLLDGVMPLGGAVRSSGTAFPPLRDVAPSLLLRTGLVLALAGVTGILVRRLTLPSIGDRLGRSIAALTVVGAAAFYAWIAWPHNGYPTNSRLHWVDWTTSEADNYFYAASKVPRTIFYEVPWLWNGINAGLLALVLIAIGRVMRLGWLASSALAASTLWAGITLLFASSAEDVMMNNTLAALVVLAVFRRWSIVTGLSLGLAVLGRPSYGILVLALVIAELVTAQRRYGTIRRIDLRYLLRELTIAGAVVVTSQVLFTLIGRRYVLTNGRLFDSGPLSSAEPIEIDGFTISAFSGSYVLHAFWVLPPLLTALALVAIGAAKRRSANVETAAYFCASGAGLLLFVHEANPLLYFNVRYLSYLVVLLVPLAWILLAPPDESEREAPEGPSRSRRSVLFVLLALSTATTPSSPLEERSSLMARPERELVAIRDELREVADGRPILTTFGGRSTRNMIAWVARTTSVGTAGDDVGDVVVVSRVDEPWADPATAVFTTESLLVHDAGADESDSSG